VGERSLTYFAAAKGAAQAITIGGADAALVTQNTGGGTVDGTTASDELAVFTVDTGAFDLQFSGGSRAFTLTVAEAEKESLTVNVTLTVTPEKTGAAVYRVTRSGERDLPVYAAGNPAKAEEWATMGSLERIRGIKDYDVPGHAFTESSSADSLIDAIAWVDQNAQTDEEYLIRVEQREELPRIVLTFVGKERVTLRLRGDGQERTLIYNALGTSSFTDPNTIYYNDTIFNGGLSISNSNYDFITLNTTYLEEGNALGSSAVPTVHKLHLENNITINGGGSGRNGVNDFQALIHTGYNARLVMLAGSKITGYTALSGDDLIIIGSTIPANAEQHAPKKFASFYMYGGAITGNTLHLTELYAQSVITIMARINSTSSERYDRFDPDDPPVFFKYGGSISGNAKTDGTPINQLAIVNSDYGTFFNMSVEADPVVLPRWPE
jgi:hypothetical protein